MISILFLILFIKIITINGQGVGQSLIGQAYESFSPCENGILTMDRLIGGPPSKENYWNGIVDVNKNFPNLTEARIELKLNAAATVTVDPEDGRILTSDKAYHISFFQPDNGYQSLKFKVQGLPREKFPNVLNLKLNELDICKDPQEWKPSILGLTNIGTIDDSSGTISNGTSNRISSETCGQRKVLYEGLITNGDPSNEGDWPWHAALFHLKGTSYEYVCGGTLLNTNTIITAAHCVIENGRFMIPERILIKLGLHNRLLAGRNVQEFRVYKVIPHEEFDFDGYKNDITLIQLATEATFTSYVQPICLWSKDQAHLQNVVNENGIVVGWGFTEKKNEPSEILSQAKMPIVDTFTCLNSNRNFFGVVITEKNFCAGFKNGTSVCNGDSGGGMIFLRDNVYRIRGIVSLGPAKVNEKLCNPKEYVVFTDVAKYLDWIENKIAKYN